MSSTISQHNPFLSVVCDKCKVPLTSDTRFEYLCGHIICRICDTGRSCEYCGHPGPANQHNNDEADSYTDDVCGACEDTAVYYCVTCPTLLCERCAQIHSVSLNRQEHQVVYLKEYPRQIHSPGVNYDIPEHVYLPRKRPADPPSSRPSPSRRRTPEQEAPDSSWSRTSEARKPFRRNPPIKQFSYSKSASSRASSVQSIQEAMEKMSEKSYDKFSTRSEKSVGTDVSGVTSTSMIKNNNFTIMVYSHNSECGSEPPGKVRLLQHPGPPTGGPCNDCAAAPDSPEYHDHGVYISRKASTLSSGSSTSFSSHCCDSHNEEFSRGRSRSRHGPHSLVSKSDTMDNISDILNLSNDPRRRAPSQETRGTSPGLLEDEPALRVEAEHFEQVQSGLPGEKEVHVVYDEERREFVAPRHSTPNKEAVKIPAASSLKSSSVSSKSSASSSDKKSVSSRGSNKLIDDILDKYEDQQLDDDIDRRSDNSDGPCMVPQKSDSPPSSHPSPLLQRMRSRSRDQDEFIDESSTEEDEEEEVEIVFDGNDTYLTHSSHYSESEGEANLSNIAEEPTLETCSATEVMVCNVKSESNLRDLEEVPDVRPNEVLLRFDEDIEPSDVEVDGVADQQLELKCESIDMDVDSDIHVSADRFITVNTIPDFLSNDKHDTGEVPEKEGSEVDDDPPQVESETPLKTSSIISDGSKNSGEKGSESKAVKSSSRSSSSERISRIPVKTSSRNSSTSSRNSSGERNSKERKRSSSRESLSKIPVRKSSRNSSTSSRNSSGERNSKERKRSSSRESLSKIPVKKSSRNSSTSSRNSSDERNSKERKRSSSRESLNRIPLRTSSRNSSTSSRNSSGDRNRTERKRSSSRECLSKIPVRSPSTESIGSRDGSRGRPSSVGKQSSRNSSRSSSNDSRSGIPVRKTSRESSISKNSSRSPSVDRKSSKIPRSSSKDSLKSDKSKASSRRDSAPKPPIPRSLSKDSIGSNKIRNKIQSNSESSFGSDDKVEVDKVKSEQPTENILEQSADMKHQYEQPTTENILEQPADTKHQSEEPTTENTLGQTADTKHQSEEPTTEVLSEVSPKEVTEHTILPEEPITFEAKAIKTFSKSPSKESLSSDKTSNSRRSSSRSSPSPLGSKIPIARSSSRESVKSSASSKGSFAYRRTKSPTGSKLPIPRSPSRESGLRCSSVSSDGSEPYSTKGLQMRFSSRESLSSNASTVSATSGKQAVLLKQTSIASSVSSAKSTDDLNKTGPSLYRKDSSASSSTKENLPQVENGHVTEQSSEPYSNTGIVRRSSNTSRTSDRSTKSEKSVRSNTSANSRRSDVSKPKTTEKDQADSLSECSGSFISDNSYLRKQHPPLDNEITMSDSDASNGPLSSNKIMLDRILSDGYTNKGENLGFMDNISDKNLSANEGSLTGVSSVIEKVESGAESDGSTVWREGKVDQPLNMTSESDRCKYVVIGEEPSTESDPNTLYFPTMSDYVKWSKNQSFSTKSLDVDSVGSIKSYGDVEYSDGEKSSLEREMLYKYAKYKKQQSLSDFEGRKLEDVLSMDEMSVTSSQVGSVHSTSSNVMSVYSLDRSDLELTSSSTSTIVDDEEEQLHHEPPSDGSHPPHYFEGKERPASRDLPEEHNLDRPVHRAASQASISSSLYSAVSKDIGQYVDAFNSAMEPHNQPARIEQEPFNRKYSKRVSALPQATPTRPSQLSATLPRNRKSTQSSEERERQTYTLPRKQKQKQEPRPLTNFLNQTYGGRAVAPAPASESRLLSRSLTFGSPDDYRKFGADQDWTRSLPRHLGRKAYMRHPSLRQVDWSIMGRKGTEPGFLMNPTGIAIDEGCVAIAEEGNGRIQIFIEDESEYCINNLQNPCGIALSRDHIYVSDIDSNVVKIYGRNALEKAILGAPGTGPGQFNEPRGIAFNECNGDLAVCDTENHRVQVFDIAGNLIKIIGTGRKGKNPGEFKEPISCTYDRWGRLLISDHCNYRVQIFDNNYQYISQFGKYGKSSGEFWGVNGLCSHRNGDILVVDSDNNCLSVHSSDGRFISVFGRRGAERWEFLYPHSVGTDEVGNVYVSDWGNHRIHIMDKKLLPYLELESHMV